MGNRRLKKEAVSQAIGQYIFRKQEVSPDQYILHVFQRGMSSKSVVIQYKISIQSVYPTYVN